MFRSVLGAASALVGLGAGVVGVGGCSTPMLNPAFSTDVMTSDAGLPGTWVCEGETRMQAIVADRGAAGYAVDLTAWYRGEEKTRLHLDVRLIRLGEATYADLFLGRNDRDALVGRYGMLALPVHQVIRCRRDADTLELRMIDGAWLDATLRQTADAVGHQRVPAGDGETVVLTASTGELQRFLERHAGDEGAFGTPFIFRRTPPSP